MAEPHLTPFEALRAALVPTTARRSVVVALVVGTLLNAINQGDVIVSGGSVNWLKVILTYLVPFCVSTYGAYCVHRFRPLDRSHPPPAS